MEARLKVADVISKRNNNLSISKFIAACLVIISHAYPLCLGKDAGDFLVSISNGQIGLGGLAVGVFFFSGGLFIARSVEKNKEARKYFYARVIKIFPPLILVIVTSIIVFGLFFSTLKLLPFLLNKGTWIYLLNAILIPIHSLPGVFVNNIYGDVVNGALWTLPVEFACYIAVFIGYKINILTKKISLIWAMLLAVAFFAFNYSGNIMLLSVSYYIQPVIIFGVGVLYYIFREDIIINKNYGILSFVLFILSIIFGIGRVGQILFFPYCFMCLIMATKQCSVEVAKLGNLSYGIYLVGFPIQQALVAINGGSMDVYMNMSMALMLSIVIAIFVYFLVEKHNKNLIIL